MAYRASIWAQVHGPLAHVRRTSDGWSWVAHVPLANGNMAHTEAVDTVRSWTSLLEWLSSLLGPVLHVVETDEGYELWPSRGGP